MRGSTVRQIVLNVRKCAINFLMKCQPEKYKQNKTYSVQCIQLVENVNVLTDTTFFNFFFLKFCSASLLGNERLLTFFHWLVISYYFHVCIVVFKG